MAKILIAEDNLLLTESLVEILEIQGHDVASVLDGEKAWELIRGGDFDVLITDYMLPSMDAVSIINRINAEKRLDYLDIIVISGFDAARFDGHPRVKANFHKPFDLKEVLAVIEN